MSIAREDVGSNHLDPTGEQKTGTQDLVSGYPQSVSLYQRLRRKCNRKDASSSQPLGGREAYLIATAEWRVSPSPGHRDLPELDQSPLSYRARSNIPLGWRTASSTQTIESPGFNNTRLQVRILANAYLHSSSRCHLNRPQDGSSDYTMTSP